MKHLLIPLTAILLLCGCSGGMTDREQLDWTSNRIKMLANEEIPPIAKKIEDIEGKIDYLIERVDYQKTASGSVYDVWNTQMSLQIKCRNYHAEEKIREENRQGVKGLPVWHEYTAMFSEKCKKAHPLPLLP